MAKKEGFTPLELFRAAYKTLQKKYEPSVIQLPEKISIAQGYFKSEPQQHLSYREFSIFRIEGRNWMVGVGKAKQQQPGEPCISDMMALPLKEKVQEIPPETLAEALQQECNYQKYALITNKENGHLKFLDTRLGQQMRSRLVTKINRYRTDNNPPITYDSELVTDITASIEDVLSTIGLI